MTTLNLVVAAGTDDAHHRADNGDFSHSTTLLRADSHTTPTSRYNAGNRFTGGPPQGSTINSAVLQFWVNGTTGDSPRCTIHLEAADAAVDFAATASVNSRARTTASVLWSADDIGAGAHKPSPDISAPVQEVVDRPDYDGTLMVLLIGGTDAGPFVGVQRDFAASYADKLDIDYTAPAEPSAGSAGGMRNGEGPGARGSYLN